MPDNFLPTLRPRVPTIPRDSSSSSSSKGEIGGDSSGIVGTEVEPFSGSSRIAPSLGPQSGPRKRHRTEPINIR